MTSLPAADLPGRPIPGSFRTEAPDAAGRTRRPPRAGSEEERSLVRPVRGRPPATRGTEGRPRSEAEVRLASIVESSQDAIIGKTLEGIITDWNEAARRMYGYSPEEAIGRSITMLAPAERLAEVAEVLRRVANGERVENLETVRIRKDGARIDVAVTVSPIRDDDGNVIGASTIARDITERNRADLERPLLLEAERAARAEAEAATERLTYLAEASTVLSGSLDYQATLNRLADIAVSRLA